jgi:hypothetical protein
MLIANNVNILALNMRMALRSHTRIKPSPTYGRKPAEGTHGALLEVAARLSGASNPWMTASLFLNSGGHASVT